MDCENAIQAEKIANDTNKNVKKKVKNNKKQLRERQEKLVNNAIEILKNPNEKNRRSIAIAPTGSGKTVMFCTFAKRAIAQKLVKKVLILVHRTEIFYQNVNTFKECTGATEGVADKKIKHSLVCQEDKNLDGQVVFAMVLTLNNLFKNEPDIMRSFDLVIVDEAHHTAANTYKKMLASIREDAFLFGFTATPKRGDGQKLTGQYTHICDQIFMHELIANKLLVPPKILQAVYNKGFLEKLLSTKNKGGDYNQDAASLVLDDDFVHDEMYKIWRKNAEDRQTVVFCTVVKHAASVCSYFLEKGKKAAYIYGDMDDKNRKKILQEYQKGFIQILVNVAILIEGWDDPITSCVVILRPSSYVPVVMQMIGRGLRSLPNSTPQMHLNTPPKDTLEGSNLPAECPLKENCIVIDMGVSCTRIRSLEQFLDFGLTKEEKKRLEVEKRKKAEAKKEEREAQKQLEREELNRKSFIDKLKSAMEEFLERALNLQASDEISGGRSECHWFEFKCIDFSIFIAIEFDFCAIEIFQNTTDPEKFKNFAYGIFRTKGEQRGQHTLLGSVSEVRIALEALVMNAGGAQDKNWYDTIMSDKQSALLRKITASTLAKLAESTREDLDYFTKGEASAILDLHFACDILYTDFQNRFFDYLVDFEKWQKLKQLPDHMRAASEKLLVVI